MTEPAKDLPLHSKATTNFPDHIKAANLPPTSNVHVVSPDHLATDKAREHRGRRSLIILLVLLGLVFLVGFSFIGWYYYKLVYSAPKVFTTDCFELSLPASYRPTANESDPATGEASSCHIELAAIGKGGAVAVQMQKQYEAGQMNQAEAIIKKFIAGDSVRKTVEEPI